MPHDIEHPLDVAALRTDDELVERLVAGLVAPRDVPASARGTDDELIAMLAAWVAEVRPVAIATPGAAVARTGTDRPRGAGREEVPASIRARIGGESDEPTGLRPKTGGGP